MPKETIRAGDSSVAIEVQWGRRTFVQLGSINQAAADENPGSEESGWFVDIDRATVNKLIRVLRRARDQAYGADE